MTAEWKVTTRVSWGQRCLISPRCSIPEGTLNATAIIGLCRRQLRVRKAHKPRVRCLTWRTSVTSYRPRVMWCRGDDYIIDIMGNQHTVKQLSLSSNKNQCELHRLLHIVTIRTVWLILNFGLVWFDSRCVLALKVLFTGQSGLDSAFANKLVETALTNMLCMSLLVISLLSPILPC